MKAITPPTKGPSAAIVLKVMCDVTSLNGMSWVSPNSMTMFCLAWLKVVDAVPKRKKKAAKLQKLSINSSRQWANAHTTSELIKTSR